MELFGTAGIRGPVTEVTAAQALAVGRAVGVDCQAVVVGRDGRVTGSALADAVGAGAQSAGADVWRLGQVPTPTLAFASAQLGCDGVMVTASHNPPSDNGLKLFAEGVEYDGDAERRIERRVADADGQADWRAWGTGRQRPVLGEYRQAVADFASGHGGPLDGMGVVIDCGTGMAGRATPQVLRRLGATVKALNANVDGHFAARESKPTPETLGDLRAFVAEDPDAALGIGHDGDADRIVIVDETGAVVHEDTIVAILAEHYVRASEATDPVVVTTPNASGRIDERVTAGSGRVERVALGALHEGIAAAEREGGTVVFAAEPWKHVHTGLGGWIDGVASAAVLARLVAADGLSSLRDPVTERPYRKESVPCPDEAKAPTMERLASALPERFRAADVSLDHGVRLSFDNGAWTLVRPSGTEPYVRVYAESETVDDLIGSMRAAVADAVDAETS